MTAALRAMDELFPCGVCGKHVISADAASDDPRFPGCLIHEQCKEGITWRDVSMGRDPIRFLRDASDFG